MAALFSFAYLFVAAIHVSGTLGFHDFLDYRIPIDRLWKKNPREMNAWELQMLQHSLDPKWLLSKKFRLDYDYNNKRYDPAAGWVSSEATSAANTEIPESARRKLQVKGIPTRNVDYTWNKGSDMSGHSQGVREPVFSSRLDESAVHSRAVSTNGYKRTLVLAENSRVRPLKSMAVQGKADGKDLEQKSTDGKGKMIETDHVEENSTIIRANEETSHPEPGVEANKNGTLEKEVKSEADGTTAEETGTTETVSVSSGVEEATPSPVPYDGTVDDRILESSFPATTVTVKQTVAIVHSTVDRSSLIPSSTTTFPSTAVTVSETVSPTPPTVEDTTSKGISPSMTTFSSSVVTVSETVSLTPSKTGDSSSEGLSPSKTPLSSSTVTVSKTMPLTLSTAGDSSSKGGTSTTSTMTTITDHVIVLPRIRAARIVLSSVLLAIGLVAVAVAAVCIFRERRRKLKYDQLKLLP